MSNMPKIAKVVLIVIGVVIVLGALLAYGGWELLVHSVK
jgi:hypothetical protein